MNSLFSEQPLKLTTSVSADQQDCTCIVFIWSQHDGGNVEQRQWLRFPPKPYDAKSKCKCKCKCIYSQNIWSTRLLYDKLFPFWDFNRCIRLSNLHVIIKSFSHFRSFRCLIPHTSCIIDKGLNTLEVCVPELGANLDETGRDWELFPNGVTVTRLEFSWSRGSGKFQLIIKTALIGKFLDSTDY